ncbi:MAG TPA: hypothetical protein VM434_18805 [Beijerinckiaceae bacterium]|nr:hypothetical protein [Beijerinckiaceae bacterium]
MEHKPLHRLQAVADVEAAPRCLSRRERLERWAEVLARDPTRRLKTLEEIELAPRAERPLMRADNSPFTVAFQDPVLRTEGLASDRLGDAMAFFDISERQAHRIVCSCLNGRMMESGLAAQRVRAIAKGEVGLVAAVAAIAAGALGVPTLLYLFA